MESGIRSPGAVLLSRRSASLFPYFFSEDSSNSRHIGCIPSQKQLRRVRLLAVACDTMHVPEYRAHRGLRIAWSRLTDDQRTSFMAQLSTLVGSDHPIVENANTFITEAFKPRHYMKPQDVALNAKIKRIERRHPRPSGRLENAVAELDPEERRRLEL